MSRRRSIAGKLLLIMICIGLSILARVPVQAEEACGYVIVSVEKFTIGQGYLVEPTLVPLYEGDTCAMVLDRVLKQNGYDYQYDGALNSGFYMRGIYNADNQNSVIPNAVKKMDMFLSGGELYKPPGDDTVNENAPDLFEFDYGRMSGWMYSLNGDFTDGMSLILPNDGDVMRVQYSVYGYGADLGSQYQGSVTALDIADKDALTKRIAEINADRENYFAIQGLEEKYNKAMEILQQLDVKEWKVAGVLEDLQDFEVIYPSDITVEDSIELEIHDTYSLQPVLYPEDVTAGKLFFSSSDSGIVEAQEDGLLLPKGAGEADITVTTSNGLSAVCHVTVYKNAVPMTAICAADMTIQVGTKNKIKISIMPEDTDSQYTLSYEYNTNMFSIDENGYIQGLKAGTAMVKVTANLTGDPAVTFTDQCTITVVEGAAAIGSPLDDVLKTTAGYILSVDTNPDISSQWNMIGLMRSGYPVTQNYINTFYNNVASELEEKKGVLSKSKYSEYSKLIISLTSIGKNAEDIAGYNILSSLSDFDKVKYQGINGPIWALIALNSHPSYTIPINSSVANQTTEAGLISYLMSRELEGGGWTLMGSEPDVDITAMALQALTPYYHKEGYENVTEAVDRAINWLSDVQRADGGYYTLSGSGKVENSESTSQVLTAMSMLGIDCQTDARFIKGRNSVVNALLSYRKGGGFMHVKPGSATNGGGQSGAIDGMATEQAFYALSAYKRLLSGQTALYDMSDINLSSGNKSEPTTGAKSEDTTRATQNTQSAQTTQKKTDTTAQKNIKVSKLTLNYKQMTLQKGKTRTLKLLVSPTNATNQKVKWTSSNTKVVTVNQKGKIKGIKVGTAKITVTAQDGSKKKAVCKVVVKKATSSSSGSRSSGSSGKVKVTAVSLNYKQISLARGTSRNLSASVSPANASNKKLTWTSSNKSIATVSQSGTVTGKRPGTVTITAKAKDGSGKSSCCTVIVYGAGSGLAGAGTAGNANGSNGSSGSGQTPKGVQQRSNAASGQQGSTANSQGNAGNTQGTGSRPSGPGATGQTAGASGNSGTSDGNSMDASTEAGAWSFDGEAYVPESSGSSNGEADVWLADGEPFPEYDAGQESAQGDMEAGYMEDLSEPEAPKDSNLPPWLSVLLGLVVPGGLAGSFKVPWQTVGDKMLLLAAFRKKE